MGNVLSALPKALHGKAKTDLQALWMAPTRQESTQAFQRFLSRYGAKYLKTTEKLAKDRGALLAFFAFPAEHGVPLRTTNPIESTFATVRQRTRRTKNGVTRTTFLGQASNWPRKRRRRGGASVLPRKWPSCSVEHATQTAFRCLTTRRRSKRSNGKPPDKTLVPWSYTRFDNSSSFSEVPHNIMVSPLRKAVSPGRLPGREPEHRERTFAAHAKVVLHD